MDLFKNVQWPDIFSDFIKKKLGFFFTCFAVIILWRMISQTGKNVTSAMRLENLKRNSFFDFKVQLHKFVAFNLASKNVTIHSKPKKLNSRIQILSKTKSSEHFLSTLCSNNNSRNSTFHNNLQCGKMTFQCLNKCKM